ncbi:MAG: transcription termination/antitermination protein NusG [Cytophagales bacterium]|nr:transcription termination/antitermination protein NusG [Cytophagales bacterium]
MADFNWYVLRAISGQERKIKSYLETELTRQNLLEHVPEVLIPSEKIYEMRNGKKVLRDKIFFPGYIIVSANLNNGETLHLINNIPGVLGFLGEGANKMTKVPTPMRQTEINRILGRVEEGNLAVSKPETKYIVGESVKVMDGPFSGFIGTVEEVFDDKKKLNVIVKIFGRNTPLELSYLQVEKQS